MICAGAVINTGTVIGANVIVNTGATVDHHASIGDHVHIAPGVHLGGEVSVGEGALVGIGAVVLPRVTRRRVEHGRRGRGRHLRRAAGCDGGRRAGAGRSPCARRSESSGQR